MRRASVTTLLLSLALFGLVSAASSAAFAQPEQPDPQPNAVPQATDQADLTPEDRTRRAQVVVRVSGTEITVGDVEDQINAQSPFLRARFQDPARLRDFVQQMVRFELMAAAAVEKGYGEHPGVVRTRKQNAVQRMIRERFEVDLTPDTIPEAEIRAYYDGNDAEFHRPEMVRASHIQVAAREDAVALIAELSEQDARAFRQAAREHSVDNETKLRGGDLRYFTAEGQGMNAGDAAVDTALAEAAFALTEVGDITGQPVVVGDVFSVVKLTGRRPEQHRTFEEAEQTIRLRTWRTRRQSGLEGLVTELRERLAPEIHDDRLAPIHLDPLPEPEGAPAAAEPPPHGGAPAPTPAAPTEQPAPAP
ncbi:MAG: peptidyl-prolyl cis-trans isomerase [Deltaproteobacteria bacterium]|nr:peptidyl-prolyl cis-trans isomerase [Deltaproteobacteria bacterium]